jgi:UDP-N-acetyl-alpha-D-muramoyl-L-alanyl-L-glutamate epimerase
MKSRYKKFILKRYAFDKVAKTLRLYYGYDEALEFCETYTFDFEFVDYDEAALDQAIQLLFFVAGVSYYKMYPGCKIVVQAGRIDKSLATYLSQTYQNGLGEFFYINKLNPRSRINFSTNSRRLKPHKVASDGQLIGIGGGKDSLVSVELLRDQPKIATWSLNHRSQLEPLVERIGLAHFWVGREWDPQIQQLNQQDALNGHIPISAIFSCVGTIVSLLSGYRDNIVSNESTASEPNLRYKGVAINHQYSKSIEYEHSFQYVLYHLFGDSLRYYSLLRPFSEVRIAEIFAQNDFQKYHDVFSSCNRAFTHDQHHIFWDGSCPKCAFVFLALTPFVERNELEKLFHGKNLLLDPELEPTYRQLLGIDDDKPLDCVGEVKESRAAMRLAQQVYPELAKYKFEIPKNYDFRRWSHDLMPKDSYALLHSKLDSTTGQPEKPVRAAKKSRRKIFGSLGLMLIILILAAWRIVAALNQPATATIQAGKVKATGYSVDLTPITKVGKYASFNYPAGLTAEPVSTFAAPNLEEFTFHAQDVESWLLAINIANLPDGQISQNSSYNLRKANPATYHESQETVNGSPVILMTDTTASGFSQAAFLVHGTLIGTISLTGDDAAGTQPLQQAFNMVLQSWKWLQ